MQQTLEVKESTSYKTRIPGFEERLSDELVIALAGPIASGCSATATTPISVDLVKRYGLSAPVNRSDLSQQPIYDY